MKRFLLVLMFVVIILGGLAAGAFFGVGYYLSPQDQLAKTDAIVAISGGETDARTAEAVRLYKDGWAPKLIFSGAALDPNGPSNAQAMATAAERAGVPFQDIELDEVAANTRQNATGVAGIVQHHGYRSLILVTSPYHQRRAEITFHRVLGSTFPLINHSSYDHQWRRSHWWATPYSQSVTLSEIQKIAFELASGHAQ
ncbi:MAG: exported protein of unknown function [Patescibacteria group bacterium]|jgi:uncharacterized SAM-binding protein YcdF (DUF218 family)|nr:exported protein of unknown function [Patescibacteria group bacterium]